MIDAFINHLLELRSKLHCFHGSGKQQECARRLYSMKRIYLIGLMFLGVAGFAAAQPTTVTTDVLGAHLNYGRGCAACHAPHSGAYGNGNAKTADPTSGNIALWGEDVASLYGKTIITGQSEHG